MKKLYCLLIFLNCCLHSLQAQDGKQSAVMMKMLELKTALINKDSITLSRLLADDVTYGHTNGLIQTKAQLIRDVVSSVQDYKSIDPSNMNIRVFENTGIVTMKSEVKMKYNGNPLELSMYVTLVWINKDGVWKLVARQSVKNN